jgi:hypothetical protein
MWDLDAAITDVEANIYAKKPRRGISQTDYQRVVLNHPAFCAQYNAIMLGLLDGPLSESAIHAFLDGVEAAVGPALAEDPYAGFGSSEAVAAHFAGLRGWASRRIVNVRGQVQANQPPPRP